MTKRAQLADGRVLEFPDDTPTEVIDRVVKELVAAGKSPTPAPAPVAAAPAATPVVAAPLTGTRETAPLKEVKPAGIFDYFTDRQAAIKQDRENRAYLADQMQRAQLKDMETQTGFFDRLGDMFSRGLLSARSGIKDVQAAIETDPELKKQFTQEARRFAADKGVEIKGATTEQDVKDNFLRNAIPYIIEKGAESLPQMIASFNPLGVLGVALPSNLGGQAREAAELQGRQDVSGTDVAKVAPGALAVTALDTLGLGGILAAPAKTALGRIGKAALLEGGTEAIQSAIEYANPRVVTGSDIDAGEMFEQAAFGALAGAGIGGGLRGVGEAVAAPFRPDGEVTREGVPVAPKIKQEFQKLAAQEVAAVMTANPSMDQKAAVEVVAERAEELLTQAATNVVGAEGEADVVPDADTGMDVTGGVGAGVAPDIEPPAATTGAPDLGEAVAGGLERPVPSVSVPAVGEGARVSPLTATPAPEVVAPTPVLEPEMVAPVPAPVFDITPIMEAPTRKERTSAAKYIASDIVIATPELQGLPAKTYGQAVNQMVNAASRGEQFDPVDIIYKVAEIERPAPAAPAPAFEPMAAPAVPAAPSVDEVAVAPVKAAIEAAAAPTPTAGPIPTLAQASAREVGITPTPPPPPPVQAAPPPAAPVTPPALPEMAAPTITPPPAAPVTPPAPPEMAAPTIEPTPAPPAPPAVRTMNDMAGIGTVNPDNTNEVLVEGGGIQLTPLADNILKVDSLRAVETGGGRKAMEQLTKVADANGTELQLSPEPFAAEAGKEMTPTELTEWYSGFGFQEQPDGTMVRPAPTAAPSTITPAAAATPQEILAGIEDFAVSEAQDRDLDPDAFVEGARDAARGVEPVSDDIILKNQGQDALDAYKAGVQFGQDRVAEAQATATPAPAEVAPVAPTVQEPVQPTVEAAPEGGIEPLTNVSVDKALSVKLTKAQIKRLEEAAGIRRMKLSNMQKRIAQSRNSTETMNLAGKLMLIAKNPDADVNMLTNLFNSVPPPVLSAVLSFLDTNDVVRLGERAGMANPTRINDMVRNEYIPYVNRLMQRASRLSEEWADFTADSPEGADAMADVMFYSNMIDVDPALAPNAAAYMKIDQKLQGLLAAQAKATDPKKKSNLKGQVTERRGEITRLYSGGEDIDPSGNPVVVKGWNDVPPEGKQIFRKARDHYREDFKEHYRLLMERIDDADFDEDTTERLKASVEDMFADAMKRAIYFPMKRFGEYWVSVGKGASGEFHMFESFVSQQAFIARRRLAGDIRSVSSGYGRDSLRKLSGEVSDVSEALKGILNMIDTGGAADPNLLKDGIFQMYLSSLPEADIRRRFIHRQFKTGFSTDVLRTFATTSVASANQLGRLAYNGKINNLIDQSYAETEEQSSKPRLDAITTELKNRLGITLSGDAETFADRVANGFAKGTFLWLLSSPKSAFMNLTQLHLTGFPILTSEFGEAATTAMAARYTGQLLTGQRIAYAVRDEEGNVRLSAPKFTAQSSAYIRGLQETDPDRYAAMQKAWLYGEEREVTQSTFTSAQSIYEQSNKPSGELGFMQSLRAGNKGDATKQAVSNTIDGMGAMFHHSERIGREIMYMSAFELAYDRNLKQGMDPEVAADEAMATAVKLTNEGMFDFSNWNKPRAFKAPVGRVALQMRAYSFQMTSLLARSTFNLIAAQRTKAERLAAARVFFGVGAMTTLYAGLRSSQFYVLGMLGYGMYKFFEGLGEDDEEEQEIKQGVVSSETVERQYMKFADSEGRELGKKDMDMFIRTSWIPETFTGGLQEVFGFSDDTADKLSLVADIGLPALAGVDLSNSVALTNLWHPVDTKSDNAEAQSFEALGRIILGPSGSFITAWNKFDDEANKGNLDKAVEALLPAAVRNYVKSERLQEEGLVIGKNQDVVLKDPSFYTAYISGIQALGFPEAETSRDMQLDIRAGEIEREVAQERTDLLDKRYRAILNMATDPSEDAERELAKVERDIQIYGLNYPSNAIDEDTKLRSFEQKQQEAAERMYGLGYNPKIPVRQPMAEERMERMLEEK